MDVLLLFSFSFRVREFLEKEVGCEYRTVIDLIVLSTLCTYLKTSVTYNKT